MRIAIDFDGTIANTYALQQQFCKERFGIHLPLEASVGALREKFLRDEQIKEIKEFVHGEATLSAPLVAGAREAMQKLILEGHTIIVLTGRVKAGAAYAKEYLKQNKIPYHHFLFVSDDEPRRLGDGTVLSKRVVLKRLRFDVMIDDQLKGLAELTTAGVAIIIVDQPWNREDKIPAGVVRLPHWNAILQFLLEGVPARTA
jgi:uncharacterized HAD superfamily protein